MGTATGTRNDGPDQSRDFVGAYPYLAILIRDYPDRPNLKTLRCDFLLNDAARRYKANELEPTLAMLEELRRFAPEYKPQVVLTVISRVTNSLMESMQKSGKLDDAQRLLSRLKADYPGNEVESVRIWDEKFLTMAKERSGRERLRRAIARIGVKRVSLLWKAFICIRDSRWQGIGARDRCGLSAGACGRDAVGLRT